VFAGPYLPHAIKGAAMVQTPDGTRHGPFFENIFFEKFEKS
jgi:hypothetical protein